MALLHLIPQVGIVLKIELAALKSRWGGSATCGAAVAERPSVDLGGGSALVPAPAVPKGHGGGFDWNRWLQS